MKLREIAHSRAGDKGNTSTISVIAREPADYELLCKALTAERVKDHFSGIVTGAITRYEMPGIAALNFVLEGSLGGGVTRSIALDAHGKSLSSLMLEIEID